MKKATDMHHSFFMNHAVQLAEKGRFLTAPNPCVGAVLVYKNTIIAEGYHTGYGKPHAEIECLCNAIEKGIFHDKIQSGLHFSNPVLQNKINACKDVRYTEKIHIEQCSMYVTLEPCNHFGKTPPCSRAIAESGIKSVYVGCPDPNPKASGGCEYLKEHGIQVHTGLCENECRELIADFLLWQQEKRPFCILKMACTLDGKIGPAEGHSHKISGKESQKATMQMRKNMALANGAVMVGSRTFFEDNPQLTVRGTETDKQPLAIIVSRKLPPIKNGKTGFYCLDERKNTVFFTSSHTGQEKADFDSLGIPLENIDKNIDGTLNLKQLFELALQKYHCPYIYCEGGAKLAQALLKEGLVDMLILYLAPYILGDDTAKTVFSGNSVLTMQEAYRLKIVKTELVGADLHICLKPEKVCLQD